MGWFEAPLSPSLVLQFSFGGGFTLPTTTSWTLTSGVLFAFLFERWTVCVHPELLQGSTILLLQLL